MVGELDPGNPHVQFDEGALETCDSATRLCPTLLPGVVENSRGLNKVLGRQTTAVDARPSKRRRLRHGCRFPRLRRSQGLPQTPSIPNPELQGQSAVPYICLCRFRAGFTPHLSPVPMSPQKVVTERRNTEKHDN